MSNLHLHCPPSHLLQPSFTALAALTYTKGLATITCSLPGCLLPSPPVMALLCHIHFLASAPCTQTPAFCCLLLSTSSLQPLSTLPTPFSPFGGLICAPPRLRTVSERKERKQPEMCYLPPSTASSTSDVGTSTSALSKSSSIKIISSTSIPSHVRT
ncbi:hypothetical protein P691DRAFT_767696 [Macrolepiota fuliginosa MF-IS2]|uniref:Uncharacterized protein n=1 Tax=Macrolepiota fuliginosa MF-IS2 TaxID=1400762 RepID=A0A9P5WZ29_9AGAR|nr:hypothetical protein P691DRAFT_767696 [Macrolepiota fuliginosa MF-IS2]